MADYVSRYVKDNTSAMILTTAEQQQNARYIWQYMRTKYNWTLNAVSGMLGNIAAESTINPVRPQNNAVNNRWYPSGPGYTGNAPNPTDTWYGFGLWQITPFIALSGRRENPYNFGNWALSRGYTFDYNTGGTAGGMDIQLDWLMSGAPEHAYYNSAEPSKNQAKWYDDNRAPLRAKTPAIYGQLAASPEDCAKTFYWDFERSGAGNPGNRPTQARKWYDYLSGQPPLPPQPQPTNTKRNFIILAYAAGIINDR